MLWKLENFSGGVKRNFYFVELWDRLYWKLGLGYNCRGNRVIKKIVCRNLIVERVVVGFWDEVFG